MKSNATLRWVVLAVVLLLVAGICLPVHNSVGRRSPVTVQRDRLGHVWLALQQYAGDHDGRFPPSISDLDPFPLPPEARQFHDLTTGQPSDWLYYPGHTVHDPPGTVLAAFPVPVVEREWFVIRVEHRVLTSIGTPTEYIPEAEFQQRLTPISRP